MHIPDGFLDGKTLAAAAILSTGGVGMAVWQTRDLPPRRVPLMGLSAAFVFAAQMLNFPVAGGTSGHLLGGVLTAVLLGPSAAILVLTAVLVVQCLLFADGGLLALGANVLNMGIVDSVGGYIVYRLGCRLLPGTRGRVASVAFAAWFGAVLASVVCSGELVVSHAAAPGVVLPAMLGVHMLIGVGEALITTLVLLTVWKARPDLADWQSPRGLDPVMRGEERPRETSPSRGLSLGVGRAGLGAFFAYGLLIALTLAAFVSPFASPWPDGLDRVSEKLGFGGRANTHPAPIPDYHMPGVGHVGIATALAGLIGTLVALGLALLLARLLVSRTALLAEAADAQDPLDAGAPPSAAAR